MEIKETGKLKLIELEEISLIGTLENTIGTLRKTVQDGSLLIRTYAIKGAFGKGDIVVYLFNGITVSLRKIWLDKDILLHVKNDFPEIFQLSFLLDGEVIIYQPLGEEYLYESQDCFFGSLEKFHGKVRISKQKVFHEVNVKIPESYLRDQGVLSNFELKEGGNEQFIRAITNELLPIVIAIEKCTLTGCLMKMFLEAKILELIVLYISTNKEPSLEFKGDSVAKKLYAVKELVLKNLDKNYSLKELSLTFGLNEFELKKEFKRIFGYSVNKYIKNEKMLFAANLLLSTQETVYEIAEKIGYKNATHFSAAFKKTHNMSPKKYRNSSLLLP
ncbi:MAG: AraC family transcriptional regulator [Cellulophaga sp.]